MATRDPRRSGNPAKRAAANTASTAPGTRATVSSRSRGLLLRLSKLPPLVIPGAVLVLMLVGLVAPLPYALPALGVLAVFVGWLAYLSWPVLSTKARLMRGIMLGILIGAAVARVKGWL